MLAQLLTRHLCPSPPPGLTPFLALAAQDDGTIFIHCTGCGWNEDVNPNVQPITSISEVVA